MRTIVAASCAGTMIEWYDFFIFGSLAAILAAQFYPPNNPTLGLLQTFATFAVGFAIRPLGALVFGRIGDRLGRKTAFLTTLLIMGGATACIGLLPGYGTIGVAAPLLVVALRLLQGLALGGEYGGAAVYVGEHSPPGQRGYYTGFIYTTGTAGLLLSLVVILVTRRAVGERAFLEWGWRIPFLLSAALVVISYYIRLRLSESPMFAALKAEGKTSEAPIRDTFGGSRWKSIAVLLFGLLAGHAVVWYTGQFYALFFLQTVLKLPLDVAYTCVTIALVLGAPCFVFFGWLSDRVGRTPIIFTGLALGALGYYPIYHAMTAAAAAPANVPLLTALVFLQVLFAAINTGPLGALLVEAFPTTVRYTSVSFVHHSGTGWFGGFLPLIATALVARTGNIYAGLWYPIGIATMTCIIGVLFVRDPVPQS